MHQPYSSSRGVGGAVPHRLLRCPVLAVLVQLRLADGHGGQLQPLPAVLPSDWSAHPEPQAQLQAQAPAAAAPDQPEYSAGYMHRHGHRRQHRRRAAMATTTTTMAPGCWHAAPELGQRAGHAAPGVAAARLLGRLQVKEYEGVMKDGRVARASVAASGDSGTSGSLAAAPSQFSVALQLWCVPSTDLAGRRGAAGQVWSGRMAAGGRWAGRDEPAPC